MVLEAVKSRLATAGFEIISEAPLPNGSGIRLDLKNGQIINVFKTGKLSFQGKKSQAVEDLFKEAAPTASVLSKKVFVVYGHDEEAKKGVELVLRRFGLDPIIFDQLPSEGQTIIEKLENYTEQIGFGVVLATPDDEGHRKGRADEKAFRARQNVVLELGMLLKHLGRGKVAILMKEQASMEKPSDIQGLIYIPFKDKVEEVQVALAKEMVAKGYSINVNQLC